MILGMGTEYLPPQKLKNCYLNFENLTILIGSKYKNIFNYIDLYIILYINYLYL